MADEVGIELVPAEKMDEALSEVVSIRVDAKTL